MTNSYSPPLTISATLSATPWAFISGCWSYVGTLGEGTISRCSFSNCFSTPPLKKKVTWAYFSVSRRDGEVSCNGRATRDGRLACDVALLDALLGEPFSQDVGHTGRRESDREGELGVVPGHGGDVLTNNDR